MSILVTGGAGYIGSHMVLALLEHEISTVVIDNLSTGHRRLVPGSANFYEGDIGDSDLVTRILTQHKVEAVIHFAGSIVVPDSIADPLGYYANNTINSHSLINACIEQNVRNFVFSSTAAVYGMPQKEKVTEKDRLQPISPYGTSKLMTELMLRDAAAVHDFNYVALRYFNVAGADPLGRSGQCSENATHLLKVAMQAATGQRSELKIFGRDYDTRDGTCIRDYIHVTDLITAHMNALDYLKSGRPSDTFNCGYETGTSVLEIVESVKKVLGKDFDVEDAPARDGDPAVLIADAHKARSELGWKSQYQLDDIIKSAFEWEQSLLSTNESMD